jgi:hypothetical protein
MLAAAVVDISAVVEQPQETIWPLAAAAAVRRILPT